MKKIDVNNRLEFLAKTFDIFECESVDDVVDENGVPPEGTPIDGKINALRLEGYVSKPIMDKDNGILAILGADHGIETTSTPTITFNPQKIPIPLVVAMTENNANIPTYNHKRT